VLRTIEDLSVKRGESFNLTINKILEDYLNLKEENKLSLEEFYKELLI